MRAGALRGPLVFLFLMTTIKNESEAMQYSYSFPPAPGSRQQRNSPWWLLACVLLALTAAHASPALAQNRPAEVPAVARQNAVAATPGTAADAAAAAGGSTERYQEWLISCEGPANGRYCTLEQDLRRREDNRRLVLLEVKPESMDSALVGLTLPLGLDLRSGLALQIDDGPMVQGVPYRTCLQQGCLVSMRFDQGTLEGMRTGKVLKVRTGVASGGVADFQLPLAGFAQAYVRMVALAATATASPAVSGRRP